MIYLECAKNRWFWSKNTVLCPFSGFLMGQDFRSCIWSGRRGLPSPPLPYSQPGRKKTVFLRLPNKNCWTVVFKISQIVIQWANWLCNRSAFLLNCLVDGPEVPKIDYECLVTLFSQMACQKKGQKWPKPWCSNILKAIISGFYNDKRWNWF